MSHPHREFNDEHIPLAYFITFRCYGTWLHGDRRGSVDRFHNIYGTPRLPRTSNGKTTSVVISNILPLGLTGDNEK